MPDAYNRSHIDLTSDPHHLISTFLEFVIDRLDAHS
jgi:hypothetical protein